MKKEEAKLGVCVGHKLALWPYENGNRSTEKASCQTSHRPHKIKLIG